MLGWIWRNKREEDMLSGLIEYIIAILTHKHNNIIDHKRNKYIKKHKTVEECKERYPYIMTGHYLYRSTLTDIVKDNKKGVECKNE